MARLVAGWNNDGGLAVQRCGDHANSGVGVGREKHLAIGLIPVPLLHFRQNITADVHHRCSFQETPILEGGR